MRSKLNLRRYDRDTASEASPALQFAAYSYHQADMHTKRFSAQREKRVLNSSCGGKTRTRRQEQVPALQFAAYSYHRADMHTKRFSAQREKSVPNSNLGGSEGRSPLTSFRRVSFARPRMRSPRRGACRPEADLRYLAGFAPENFRRNFSKTGPKKDGPHRDRPF